MADNGYVDPASTPPAVDDIAGVYYQRIKLVDGTLDSDAAIPGSVARGLTVDPRPKASRIQVASAGLTTATTSYSGGDQMGTQFTFPNAARSAGGSGIVQSATILDKAIVTAAMDLYLFDRSITPVADNAAVAFSDADMAFCVGVLRFGPGLQNANSRLATIESSGLGYVCNGTDLFGALVTRGAHSFFGAVTDLVVSLHVLQD